MSVCVHLLVKEACLASTYSNGDLSISLSHRSLSDLEVNNYNDYHNSSNIDI